MIVGNNDNKKETNKITNKIEKNMKNIILNFLLAPHTSGPRDVPRCGALSLLQKDAALQGDPAETAARLNVKLRDLRDCLVQSYCLFYTEFKTRDSEI